jgi:hypothetical protein
MYFFNSLKRHFSRLWPAAYHVCVFVDDGHHEGAVDVALQRRQRVKVGNERLLARKVIQQTTYDSFLHCLHLHKTFFIKQIGCFGGNENVHSKSLIQYRYKKI